MSTIMSSITVVRHGETEWNRRGMHQGMLDSPLTARGREQAYQVAELLQHYTFHRLYSSDLGRAAETARIIGTALKLTINFDERLRERNLGKFGGLTVDQCKAEYPEIYERYKTGDPDYVVPGGESAAQAYERSIGCFEELAVRYPGESVLVISHGLILSYFLKYSLGIPLGQKIRFTLKNCSVNRFLKGENGWMLDTWGEAGPGGRDNLTDPAMIH
jgi:2,3-bisphosphoglycerate-dependent phosphoglycerate mutase